jgi:hypothetical protein
MVGAGRGTRTVRIKDEFTLLFGVPLPGLDDGRFDIAEQCDLEFAGTGLARLVGLEYPVPAA